MDYLIFRELTSADHEEYSCSGCGEWDTGDLNHLHLHQDFVILTFSFSTLLINVLNS